MKDREFTTITPMSQPDYRDLISHVSEAVWPEFMLHDPVANQHWDGLFENFPDFQFALMDPDSDEIAGIGNSVPLHWDAGLEQLPDDGWDWALIQSISDYTAGIEPTMLCGLQISISPEYQGRQLSKVLLQHMVALACEKRFSTVIIPVRPSTKDQYPLAPIEKYIEWKNDEGLPFDPWLRVHVRNGGKIIKPCPEAMKIIGSISDWEEWTGMKFFESGRYIVPGALVPVTMDIPADQGEYIEPNVWVVHEVDIQK